MSLHDLAWRVRRVKVSVALEIALRQLQGPASTYQLAESVASLLGAADEATLVARDLQKLAPLLPSYAARGPEKSDKYGTRRPWIWNPKGGSKVEALVTEAHRQAASDLGLTVAQYLALVRGAEPAPKTPPGEPAIPDWDK
jgi:hypothetical protein